MNHVIIPDKIKDQDRNIEKCDINFTNYTDLKKESLEIFLRKVCTE